MVQAPSLAASRQFTLLPLRRGFARGKTFVRRKSANRQKAAWVHFWSRSQDVKISRLKPEAASTLLINMPGRKGRIWEQIFGAVSKFGPHLQMWIPFSSAQSASSTV